MQERIEKNQKVRISYTLKDTNGQVIEDVPVNHPISYLHGYQNIVPGLEKVLEGHSAGEKIHATIPFEQAYGPYMKELMMEVPREELAEVADLKVGMEIEMLEPEDDDEDEDFDEALEEQLRTPEDPEELFHADEEEDFDDDDDEPAVFTVREIKNDTVVLDGNHPLAGKDLIFDVVVLGVETASVIEIEQGYPTEMEDWEG